MCGHGCGSVGTGSSVVLTTLTSAGAAGAAGVGLVVVVVFVVVVVSPDGGIPRGEESIVVKLPTSPDVIAIRAVRMDGSAYVWRKRDRAIEPTPMNANSAMATTTIRITFGFVCPMF